MKIHQETEKKIDLLLSQMTLHEKVGQLHQVAPSKVGGFEVSAEEAKAMYEAGEIDEREYEAALNHTALFLHDDAIRRGEIGSFISVQDAGTANRLQKIAVEESRLGIPLIFGLDVIHGYRTIFPIPLAEACSFNDGIFELSAQVAAREASEDGVNWTFAPMADIARDARWGRIAEGAGEDPYLASRFAAAKVRGFQGKELSDRDRIAACIKHFAAYGACAGGRDYDTVDMSLPLFYEIYLPPYAAAVRAGCATAMAAFNDLNGVPCTTNRFLLQTLLREKLGFNGFVISDANAIRECINHGTARNEREAAKQALEAGLDMDLGANVYTACLEDMVNKGELAVQYLDAAVRNILRVKFALGLFEHPYADTPEKKRTALCADHRAAARDAAKRSIVLLKNENRTLPLSKTANIAVVGSVANDRQAMLGTWSFTGSAAAAISLVDALGRRNASFRFVPCCSETDPLDEEQLQKALEGADIVLAALSYQASGEAQSCCHLTLPGDQSRMLETISRCGKPVVSVLFNGRPVAVPEVVAYSDAVLEAWHLGTEAGSAVCDVLFGDYNPSGRLTATFPNASGECPVYYNHPSTGRPRGAAKWTSKYMDSPLTPLFPFGYGLSYTTFSYGELSLRIEGDCVTATVPVTNDGTMAGEETVQLYIHRRCAQRVRPVRELKGYQKVFLQPGETKEVSMTVTKDELGYYAVDGNWDTGESDFDIWLAHDSTSGSKGEFRL
mgnify:CR=1 FL=1